MSREPKKKPGEFLRAKARHRNRQKNSEALKKLKNGEPAEVWAFDFDGKWRKFQVSPLEEICRYDRNYVLCLYTGRLRVMQLILVGSSYPSYRVVSNDRGAAIDPGQIFGIVNEDAI